MTDTTAPRTAAPPSDAAQIALVKAIWTCIVDASSMNVVMHGPEVNAAIREFRAAIEAEAVEPLLALVRALEAAKIPHLVVDGDCWYSCGLAVDPYDGEPACCNEEERGKRCTCGADRHNAAIDEAIAALPESVRVAARKPE